MKYLWLMVILSGLNFSYAATDFVVAGQKSEHPIVNTILVPTNNYRGDDGGRQARCGFILRDGSQLALFRDRTDLFTCQSLLEKIKQAREVRCNSIEDSRGHGGFNHFCEDLTIID